MDWPQLPPVSMSTAGVVILYSSLDMRSGSRTYLGAFIARGRERTLIGWSNGFLIVHPSNLVTSVNRIWSAANLFILPVQRVCPLSPPRPG